MSCFLKMAALFYGNIDRLHSAAIGAFEGRADMHDVLEWLGLLAQLHLTGEMNCAGGVVGFRPAEIHGCRAWGAAGAGHCAREAMGGLGDAGGLAK